MKQILRAFRTEFKQGFRRENGFKHYNWIESTLRKKTKELFMNDFGISEELYDRNEAIFYCLVHSSKKEIELRSSGIQPLPFVNIINEVCG